MDLCVGCVCVFVCLLFVFPHMFLNSRGNLQERAQKNVCQNYGPRGFTF